jgi:hypothetical protein
MSRDEFRFLFLWIFKLPMESLNQYARYVITHSAVLNLTFVHTVEKRINLPVLICFEKITFVSNACTAAYNMHVGKFRPWKITFKFFRCWSSSTENSRSAIQFSSYMYTDIHILFRTPSFKDLIGAIFSPLAPTFEHRVDLSVSYLHTVGFLGREIRSSQGLYLNTRQHKHRKTYTHIKHPCPEWDSNLWSRLPGERRQYMP